MPEPAANGRQPEDICCEFAEFEFGEMVEIVPLDHLHYSQYRQIFEIGWKEDGQDLELRGHIVPVEVECESRLALRWPRQGGGYL